MKLWKKFIGFEFFDSLLSYFTFMTLILASQSFLLMTQPQHMWWLIIMQAAYFISIMIFTFLAGYGDDQGRTRFANVLYAVVIATFTLIGCLINFKYHLMATFIVFVTSFIFSKLRQCQKYKYESDEHKFLTWLSRVFQTRVFYGISQTILVFGSFVLLGVFWLNVSTINVAVRYIVFGIYLFLIPMLGIFEGVGEAEEQHRRAYLEDAKRRGKEPPAGW